MSLTRRLLSSLDRPGGRTLLAALGTAYARARGAEVSTFFRGQWMHRVGSYVIPDGERFPVYRNSPKCWKDELDLWFSDAAGYWYKLYSPKPGDVIVDVGAGRGEDTLPFSKAVGPTGKVIAIEAQLASFELLKKLCVLNDLDNVVPVHAAVSDEDGVMYAETSNEGWRFDVVVDRSRASPCAAPVRGVTLDRLLSELRIDRLDFLKMNIEGAERRALLGARETARRTAFMCICCHDFRGDRGESDDFRTRDFTQQWLTDAGFRVADFAYRSPWERDHVHAKRLVRDGDYRALGSFHE
jgi:FkbM family methyltransferase